MLKLAENKSELKQTNPKRTLYIGCTGFVIVEFCRKVKLSISKREF